MDAIWGFIPSVLMMASPIMIVALGGLICEKSGIVNIGLEGLLNIGAFTAATVYVLMQGYGALGFWAAFSVAILASTLFSAIHAYASVTHKADQIISGTGINMLSIGLTIFLSQLIFKTERTAAFSIGLKPGLFGIYNTAYMALAVFLLTWYILYKRPFGLRLRACGEHPAAAQSAGINVARMQYFGVLASGALAGLAGSALVLTQTIQYTSNLINGKGFIALAAISFGRWLPKGVAGASLLFGGAVAFSVYAGSFIQFNKFITPEFFHALPYTITFVALIFFSVKNSKKEGLLK